MEKDNQLSARQSLEIIESTIRTCQKDFQRSGGVHLLIWGAIVLLASGIVLLGLNYSGGNPMWHFAWFITIIGWPIDLIADRKMPASGKNVVGTAVGRIWFTFGIFATTLGIMSAIGLVSCTLPIIILMGFAAALTGWLCELWPAGASALAATVIAMLLFVGNSGGYIWVPVSIAVCALLDLIVPALLMIRAAKN